MLSGILGKIVPVTNLFEVHPITEDFSETSLAFFPAAQSITLAKKPLEGLEELVPLVRTGPQAWGERDRKVFDEQGIATYNQKEDNKGPLIIAAAATRKFKKGG